MRLLSVTDLELLVEALKFARRAANTEPFKDFLCQSFDTIVKLRNNLTSISLRQ